MRTLAADPIAVSPGSATLDASTRGLSLEPTSSRKVPPPLSGTRSSSPVRRLESSTPIWDRIAANSRLWGLNGYTGAAMSRRRGLLEAHRATHQRAGIRRNGE
jgi:hypothetical protein